MRWQVGDQVIVRDGSEADGDAGIVIKVSGGLVLVELERGAVWHCAPHELDAPRRLRGLRPEGGR